MRLLRLGFNLANLNRSMNARRGMTICAQTSTAKSLTPQLLGKIWTTKAIGTDSVWSVHRE
jgi:hypothetical protein